MSIFSQFNFSLIQYNWMLLALPLPFFAGMLLDSAAWKSLLLPILKVRVKPLFSAQLGTEALLLSIPGGFTMTDPIKLYILKKRFHIPPVEVLGSLITRHWLLGITQLVFICTACLLGFFAARLQLLTSYVQNGALFFAISMLTIVSIGLSVIVRNLVHGTLAKGIWKILYRVNIRLLRERLERSLLFFKEADRCFAALDKRTSSTIAYAALFYLLVWTMDVWETMLVASATGFHISFIYAFLFEAVLSAVRLAAFFLPGGVVVKEIGYFALFTSFHLQVSAVQIGAFVFVKRAVSIFCIIVGYLVLMGQGIAPIWKRPSITFRSIKESL